MKSSKMAEGAGFEPARRFITVYTLSRRAPSTARPSLLWPGEPSEAPIGTQQTGSEHTEPRLAPRRREGAVERSQILWRQYDIESPTVFAHMVGTRRFRNHNRALLLQQPGERDLRGRRAVASRNLGQRRVAQHVAGSERRIRHDRDFMLAAPRDEIPFGATMREVIENLICGNGLAARQSRPFCHIGAIEIADPVVTDLAVALQLQKALEGLGEGNGTAPVQQVKIDAVGGEPLQAALARSNHPAARAIVRIDFADNK